MDKFGDLLSTDLSLSKAVIKIKLREEIELWYEFWVKNDPIKSREFLDTSLILL